MDYYDPTEQGFWIHYNPRYKRGVRIPKRGSLRQRRPRKGVAPKRGPATNPVGVRAVPSGGLRLRTVLCGGSVRQVPTPWQPSQFWQQDLLIEGGASA